MADDVLAPIPAKSGLPKGDPLREGELVGALRDALARVVRTREFLEDGDPVTAYDVVRDLEDDLAGTLARERRGVV